MKLLVLEHTLIVLESWCWNVVWCWMERWNLNAGMLRAGAPLVIDILITTTIIITQSMIRVLSFSLALEFGSYKLLKVVYSSLVQI